jgi:hypothetical protein
MGAWSKVQQALDKVVNSNFVRNVKIDVNELNQNMANLAAKNKISAVPLFGADIASKTIGKKGLRQGMRDVAMDMIDSVDDDMAAKLTDAYGRGFKGPERLKKKFGKILDSDMAASFNNSIDEVVNMNAQANSLISGSTEDIKNVIGSVNYYGNAAKAYFHPQSKRVAADRLLLAGGIYAGLNVGGRVIQGGSLTRDEYGNKDIAGIPFV